MAGDSFLYERHAGGVGIAGMLERGGDREQLGALGSIDPTCPTGSVPCQWVTCETSDGLTTFKRVGGSDGPQVVPDIASALRPPTAGGTSYTFQLRRGIRYSNGAPVRPEGFRPALERIFRLNPTYGGLYYQHVVGAAACLAQPPNCDLARERPR